MAASSTGSNTSILPDDTVIYRLYPAVDGADTLVEDHLTHLAVAYTHQIQEKLGEHIWYYDPFRLSLSSVQGEKNGIPHLCGRTCFKENIEDEWLIVDLLLTLSDTNHDLVISVEDNDGQFLLIETAYQIPSWLKPETAINRIFICGGKLHIVRQPQSPGEMALLPVGRPTIRQAVSLVRNRDIPTEAPPAIQETIRKRISSCGGKCHREHCILPLPAAYIIRHHGYLVSAIVHALCERDREDVKAASKMAHFSPKKFPMVLTDVMFPRVLYAKFSHEKFHPPRNSGYSATPTAVKQYKAAMIGMKLVCGLEMLISHFGEGTAFQSRSGAQWQDFLLCLSNHGYFEEEIEGSKRYQELLRTAEGYYSEWSSMNDTKDGDDGCSTLAKAGRKVCEILERGGWTEEEFADRTPPPCDDDSWLSLNPDQLDEMMLKYSGKTESNTAAAKALDLEDSSFGMKSFVDNLSAHDGAEFPWLAENGGTVDFNPDEFIDTLENLMKKLSDGDGDDDDEDLLDSSEGEEGEEEDQEMAEVMEQMDRELLQTDVGKSFVVDNEEGSSPDDVLPIDVDFNLVQNLLESYCSQEGRPGPATNILQTLGVNLPHHDHKPRQK